ncbi:c-type cytochrome [candidate division KSB1 bacterium]|nr:c-type cytochrome [candidate division KSB1 bacterium]
MKNKSKALFGLIIILILVYPAAAIIENVLSETQEPGDVAAVSESGSEVQSISMQYTLRVGREIYMDYCSVCHGESGDGLGFNAYTLETKPRNFSDAEYMNELSDARLSETISEGGRGVNKSVLMPVWGNTLSPLEITYLVGYIRQFSRKTEAE